MSPLRPLYSRIHNSPLLLLILLLFVSGCFPTACQRRESRALFPADSLSRRLAESTPVDTLSLVWETAGNADQPLQYPRTVLFGDDDQIYVSDVQQNVVYEFLPTGVLNQTVESTLFSFPYLAGVKGDTLLVLNPDAQRIDFFYEDRSVFQIPTPPDAPSEQRLQYATAAGDNVYFKVIGEGFDGYIAKLDMEGRVVEKSMLEGPLWRHAGMLRIWGDSLISLCGYRPIADIVLPDGRVDTLNLNGFDSPMLPRSRAFMLGDVDEPPLLMPSAAVTDKHLYALNIRPGWLRIDQFDRNGQLTKRLVQDTPLFSKEFRPVDLDVRVKADSTVELAVIFIEPEPKLALYQFAPYK
ncbi:MAG: hypothetical protein AAF564_02940 [Bacteroidota bacterium]